MSCCWRISSHSAFQPFVQPLLAVIKSRPLYVLFARRNWASGSEVPLLDPVVITAPGRCRPITLQDVAGAAPPLRCPVPTLLLRISAAGLMMGKSDLDDLLPSYKRKSSWASSRREPFCWAHSSLFLSLFCFTVPLGKLAFFFFFSFFFY